VNNRLLRGSSGAALTRGGPAALRLATCMSRKRAGLARIRKLAPAEVRRLILANRLPVREVA
jgi:hypothetical protein